MCLILFFVILFLCRDLKKVKLSLRVLWFGGVINKMFIVRVDMS